MRYCAAQPSVCPWASVRNGLLSQVIGVFALVFLAAAEAWPSEIVVPDIPGIEVAVGESVPIPGPTTALAFQFSDGRIAVGNGKEGMWSHDGGHTWVSGPEGPGEKTAIDLGGGEILSIGRNSQRRDDGKFTIRQRRSLDNWQTVTAEEAVIDMPLASSTVTGDGTRVDGFLFHHGILLLPNGNVIGTMYGNYEGDALLCDGYPTELNQRKYRTVVVFSSDKGHTWGDPAPVAYDRMLGRGIPDDPRRPTAVVPAITQEGFREADLAQTPAGDLICVMRSGGRNGEGTIIFPTPLYCSRSSDGGHSWTPPAQIADRGVCPNLVTMSNGIIVCTYSRPGNWLIFSDDDGRTWKGAFQFGATGDYNYILEVAPDTIQVYHETGNGAGKMVRGTFFTVKRR